MTHFVFFLLGSVALVFMGAYGAYYGAIEGHAIGFAVSITFGFLGGLWAYVAFRGEDP